MNLPLPTQLRLMDGLDQVARSSAELDLAPAVRALAQERGLTLTDSQVQAVVAYADPQAAPPVPVDLWKRPRTLAEWEALQAQIEPERTRQRRRGWAKAIGALAGGGAVVGALITGGLVWVGLGAGLALSIAALTVGVVFLVGCAEDLSCWEDLPGMAQVRGQVAGQPSPWDEVTPRTDLFESWVHVPGLAGCLASVLASPVPWLREDHDQCMARMAAWKAQKYADEERAYNQKQHAELHRIVQHALAS